MIKKIIYKSLAVGLSLLVLMSTVSFAIEKHYCGDYLVDVAVFSEVEKCAMEGMFMQSPSTEMKSCCEDVVDLFEGQDELKIKSFEDLSPQELILASVYFNAYIINFESLPKEVIPHQDYSPPDLIFDIQIQNAVFLI